MDKTTVTLYDISNELVRLNELLEESSGEITPEIEELIQITEENKVSKLGSYHGLIRYMENTNKLIKIEMDRLKNLKEKQEKKIEFLKENVKDFMIKHDIKKIPVGINHNFRLQDSEETITDSPELVPIQYCKIVAELNPKNFNRKKLEELVKVGELTKLTIIPMKTDVKQAIEIGEKIQDAYIKKNKNLYLK